ncbi:MAG: hypothetical protein WC335_00640 [Candidatus Omnitrophota bacterium]|jgi:hypothetical protein
MFRFAPIAERKTVAIDFDMQREMIFDSAPEFQARVYMDGLQLAF